MLLNAVLWDVTSSADGEGKLEPMKVLILQLPEVVQFYIDFGKLQHTQMEDEVVFIKFPLGFVIKMT